MFGLFSRSIKPPAISEADREWVETNLTWMMKSWGLSAMREQPFFALNLDNTKLPFEMEQVHQILQQLCTRIGVDVSEVELRVFDDHFSKDWSVWNPIGSVTAPAGMIYRDHGATRLYSVHIAKSNLRNPELTVAVLAHELVHARVMSDMLLTGRELDFEQVTDLATIYFGFGLFLANVCQHNTGGWVGRSGYLHNEIIGYANAVICHVSEKDHKSFLPYLNTNTKAIFDIDSLYLQQHGSDQFSIYNLRKIEEVATDSKQVSDGFIAHDYDLVINVCKRMLVREPNNAGYLNNLGYAYLSKKDYNTARVSFTKAIDLEPFWSYPYNNRGYCTLQMGDVEGSFADLESSYRMEPENSFSWRNLGAYYLAKGDNKEALHYLLEAYKIDPSTELINFYLGHVYRSLGDEEKAVQYSERSRELEEYNYSVLGSL